MAAGRMVRTNKVLNSPYPAIPEVWWGCRKRHPTGAARMNFKLALGTGVAIVAVYCVIVIGIVRKTADYEHYHRHVGIVITAVGAVFLVAGYWKQRRIAQQPVTENGAALEDASEPAQATQHVNLLDARYVGLMSVILGLATVFILPI